MKFWDSSAIVPLLVAETTSREIEALFDEDRTLLCWWATAIECVSALTRRERDGSLTPVNLATAMERLGTLRQAWAEVQPVDRIRTLAVRLLRTHPLRAGDALQLAAAIAAAEDRPDTLPFVTLDDQLADAAAREGFSVVRPGNR